MPSSASPYAVASAPVAGAGSNSGAGDCPIWIVPLPAHPYYDHVRLTRIFQDDDTRHRVVIVDAHRLLECADRDETDYVLGPVGDWHSGKVRGIREFLDPTNARVPPMPYVTIVTRRTSGLCGWLGLRREGVVAFRNGQHRARYMAHGGAQAFPVEVHEREAELLATLCGVQT